MKKPSDKGPSLPEVDRFDYDAAALEVLDALDLDKNPPEAAASADLHAWCEEIAEMTSAKKLNAVLTENGLKLKYESKKAKAERLLRASAGDDSMPK